MYFTVGFKHQTYLCDLCDGDKSSFSAQGAAFKLDEYFTRQGHLNLGTIVQGSFFCLRKFVGGNPSLCRILLSF